MKKKSKSISSVIFWLIFPVPDNFFLIWKTVLQSNSSFLISFITSWEFPTIVVVIFRPTKHKKNFAFLTDAHPVVTTFTKNNLYPFLPLIKKELCKLTISYYRKEIFKKGNSMPPKN